MYLYELSNQKDVCSQSIGKLLLIMCILGGVNVFASFGQPEPSWWKWCVDNKLYACMMIFFLCNAIEGHLMSSGAFEITFNGKFDSAVCSHAGQGVQQMMGKQRNLANNAETGTF